LKSVGFTWAREPSANTATGAVTAGEGIIMPAILGSADAKAGVAVPAPAGATAVGAKVALAAAGTATLTVGSATIKSDAAGKMSAALSGATSVTLSVDGKVYFYGAGGAANRVPTFNFIYPNSAYDPRRALLGVQTERWVNQMGIPARGVPTGFNVIVTKVFDDVDFDVWSLGWSLGGLTPPDYLEAFFHTRHTEPGDDNPQGYSNPDVDALLDKFLETLDLNTARAIVFQLQEILAADAPYAPAFDTIIVDAWRDDKVVFPFTERMGGMPSLVNRR
jgi:hypothetical protein